jgi:hypothetical protein
MNQPNSRLGATEEELIKSQPFFAQFDWAACSKKMLNPPILSEEIEAGLEKIGDEKTIEEDLRKSMKSDDSNFLGFTFIGEPSKH